MPLVCCFRYFESKLVFQHGLIFRKIMETHILSKQLQSKCDENLSQNKYIGDLKLAIQEQEAQIAKLTNRHDQHMQIDNSGSNLLHGFRKGTYAICFCFCSLAQQRL